MRSKSFLFVLAPLRRSLCFGAKPTQKDPRARSPARQSEGGKEGPRENSESELKKEGEETSRFEIAVQGRTQSAWENSQEKEKDTVNRSQHG